MHINHVKNKCILNGYTFTYAVTLHILVILFTNINAFHTDIMYRYIHVVTVDSGKGLFEGAFHQG